MDDDDRKYRAPALEKGLDVLELLSANGGAMTTSQLSASLGRSVSELFRMIHVLEFRGYIEPAPGGFRLTNRPFALGMTQTPIKSLADAAAPVMHGLAASTMQSCHLVVPSGDQIVVIARVEGSGDMGYAVRLGYRRNLIDASSGVMFYAFASDEARGELRTLLTAQAGGRRVNGYIAAAEQAQARGHVRRESDFVEGVTDLVAPIMGSDTIVATLVVPYIRRKPAGQGEEETLIDLCKAAETISAELAAVSQV